MTNINTTELNSVYSLLLAKDGAKGYGDDKVRRYMEELPYPYSPERYEHPFPTFYEGYIAQTFPGLDKTAFEKFAAGIHGAGSRVTGIQPSHMSRQVAALMRFNIPIPWSNPDREGFYEEIMRSVIHDIGTPHIISEFEKVGDYVTALVGIFEEKYKRLLSDTYFHYLTCRLKFGLDFHHYHDSLQDISFVLHLLYDGPHSDNLELMKCLERYIKRHVSLSGVMVNEFPVTLAMVWELLHVSGNHEKVLSILKALNIDNDDGGALSLYIVLPYFHKLNSYELSDLAAALSVHIGSRPKYGGNSYTEAATWENSKVLERVVRRSIAKGNLTALCEDLLQERVDIQVPKLGYRCGDTITKYADWDMFHVFSKIPLGVMHYFFTGTNALLHVPELLKEVEFKTVTDILRVTDGLNKAYKVTKYKEETIEATRAIVEAVRPGDVGVDITTVTSLIDVLVAVAVEGYKPVNLMDPNLLNTVVTYRGYLYAEYTALARGTKINPDLFKRLIYTHMGEPGYTNMNTMLYAGDCTVDWPKKDQDGTLRRLTEGYELYKGQYKR